ncbi:MAG: PAS domain-containing protein, partial [Chthoniobacterales bacterium]|nr:PAS domain-containing protein [Chthoniobacterales bacterium]
MKNEAEVSCAAVSIVAPTGRDATLAAGTLHAAGIPSIIHASVRDLAEQIDGNTHAVLLAEEALNTVDLDKLLAWLRGRPTWCDLPLLILTSGGAREDASARILNLFGSIGNVTLLERPLQAMTLVTAVQAALRARRRQLEVRELVEQRDTILASISDAFSALDSDWRYIYVNDKAAEYAGVAKEQMIGRTVWEIYPESVGGVFEESARSALHTGKPAHFERFYERWNCWLETRIYPAAGGVVVLRADITERKNHDVLMRQSDERLKESEDRLRLATEAASIGTFDFNPQTGELSLSDRAKAIFNLAPDAAVTYATYIGALHPDDRPIAHAAADAVLEPTRSDHYDIVYRVVGSAAQNERWVAERGRVLLDAERRPTRYIGTLIDITEQKNAEIALERAKQEAEEANRAKDQFLAMLSHELRTPLTPVLMTIASLRRQTDISEELRRDLDVLQRNVELEALLIDDLLDLTRITHGKLELHRDAADVHASVEHALKISAEDLAAKELRVTRSFEAREHHCWADAARLQQVFWNLVKNAVKFTSRGGEITLHTHNDEQHDVVVEITDTGIGIAP